jgi:uncharacterized phiE125 gp8 family phage protein
VALPTVIDLKAHVGLPSDVTDQDGELADMLDAAIEMVAAIVGPLTSETVTEVHTVNSGRLILRRMPASSLTAITARHSLTDSLPLTVEEYELDPATGIVTALNGNRFYGTYVVEYAAGAADLPASVRLAILIVAAHLFETQRVPGVNRFGSPEDPAVSRGFALPNRAVELLAPYRTSVGLA